MKTKRAMKEYKCEACKTTISKGDQYARKTITLGRSTIHPDGKNAPEWAFEPYRVAMPVCANCAN